jgi:hypothetical protein
MSNAIPPILVQIAADVSQLKAGLAQAESSIKGMNSTVATANTGMQNMMGTAKKMAATFGVAFAGAQIIQFGKDVVMSASAMNESISKVNVVFGQSAESVFKFGDSAAKNMGMSNQAAIEAAGTYGNLFQAFGIGQGKATEMSTTLVQLAADLGSFNNTSTEEAINALRSGLAGETEPLKRFGVALNEVTLKNKALAMGFGEIKGAMDPAIKAQVTYALVLEQTKLAQGDYARTADGTANTMKSLSAEFANAKVAIGQALLPAFNLLLGVLKVAIPLITGLTGFFKENADALKMLTIIVAAGTAAFLTFKAVMIAKIAVSKAYVAVLAAKKAGFTLAQIAAFNFKVAITLLNNAMRANPIGLIVTALGLLAAGFVMAWKKSETFRSVVIKVVQAISNAFAKLVEIAGAFFKALGKVPGMGWAKTVGKGLDDISTKIKTASKNLSDLKSNFKGMGNVSMTTGTAGVTGGSTGGSKGDTPITTKNADAKKKAEEIKKTMADVASVYKQMNKVIADSEEKVADAQKKRDENIAEARQKYNRAVRDANRTYSRAVRDADKRLLEDTAEAYKRNKEQLESINRDYSKRTLEIERKLQEAITDLREKAAEKSADAVKKAAEKQQQIVQQSMDRLRNAFASKTGFNISEAFGEGKSGGDLLADLKTKLSAAKNLAQNAAMLQSSGFSQTFIEQVVAGGPESGNQLSQAILGSSPETIRELQAAFAEMERVSNTGLDALAKTMNSGGKLATDELRLAYEQVAVDLQESLTEINDELNKGMLEANKEFSDAMTEATVARDEKMAESAKDLLEALAEANKNYNEAIAEAQENLNDALAEAAEALSDALIDIQKSYQDAIAQIARDTQERINDLREKLLELATILRELGAMQQAQSVMKNAPTYVPFVDTPLSSKPSNLNKNGGVGVNAYGPTITQNITYPNSSAADIAAQTLSAIKFGTSGGYTPSYTTVGARDK